MTGAQGTRRPRYRKIFVLAPANGVTGGPEALHQLVDAIRSLGGEAHISYQPIEKWDAPVPEAYRGYDVAPAPLEDEAGNLIVVYEARPLLIRNFKRAATAIWWLSIDHFVNRQERPGWDEIQRCLNFSQSQYATDYLAMHGIAAAPLTDYLHRDFGKPLPSAARRNAIAYNVKSARAVERLKSRLPPLRLLQWVLVDRMDRADVSALLSQVKLYVDFGLHAGRDRMPREAALCGACVLTGLQGSAKFDADVPLPAAYKLDDRAGDFALRFGLKVPSILLAFDRHARRLDGYRRIVRNARAVFFNEVEKAFFD
jgi:hypothetical protein